MRVSRNGLAALVIVAALPAFAHDHATGVVKERMDMMEAMAKRMKVIRARIEAKRDLAAIKGDAETVASHASHRSSVSAGEHAAADGCERRHLAEPGGFRAQGSRAGDRKPKTREREPERSRCAHRTVSRGLAGLWRVPRALSDKEMRH